MELSGGAATMPRSPAHEGLDSLRRDRLEPVESLEQKGQPAPYQLADRQFFYIVMALYSSGLNSDVLYSYGLCSDAISVSWSSFLTIFH